MSTHDVSADIEAAVPLPWTVEVRMLDARGNVVATTQVAELLYGLEDVMTLTVRLCPAEILTAS